MKSELLIQNNGDKVLDNHIEIWVPLTAFSPNREKRIPEMKSGYFLAVEKFSRRKIQEKKISFLSFLRIFFEKIDYYLAK